MYTVVVSNVHFTTEFMDSSRVSAVLCLMVGIFEVVAKEEAIDRRRDVIDDGRGVLPSLFVGNE